MPTKRTRRSRGKQSNVSLAAWYFMNDQFDKLHEDECNPFDVLELQCSTPPHSELSELWNANKDIILKRWLLLYPGTRPHCWWLLDAPELPTDQHKYRVIHSIAPFVKEPRKQLSGIGTPSYGMLGVSANYSYGIPVSWVNSFDAGYYNGKAKDIHGNIINAKVKEGDFKGVAIDPNDPPIFESQASYLDRFGLLSVAEKKKSNFSYESIIDVLEGHHIII